RRREGEDVGNGTRQADVEALAGVDADRAEEAGDGVVGDELGDRLLAHALRERDERLDQQPVHWAVGEVADVFAVDLEVVERQVLEVEEGAEAGAEVVQSELAAEVA